MPRQPVDSKRTIIWRVLLLIAAALLLLVVVPQVGSLRSSAEAITTANRPLLALCLLLLGATFALPALSYMLLAVRRLRFVATLAVQMASGFTGKLLPAGLGTIGLNISYLRKQGHSTAQSAAVVTANNGIGFICFATLALIGAPFTGQHVSLPHMHIAPIYSALLLLAALAILVGLGLLFRQKIRVGMWQVLQTMSGYRHRPFRLFGAVVSGLLLPCVFAAILYYAARALGYTITPVQAFGGFMAGQLLGTATPTPGGILGAEAGVTAALTTYGLPAASALTIALLYRLVTYWIPLIAGSVVFVAIRKRYV